MRANKEQVLFFLRRQLKHCEAAATPIDQVALARNGVDYANRKKLLDLSEEATKDSELEAASLRRAIEHIDATMQ